MKYIALCCLLAALCYTADEARAQTSPISVGLKGGIAITTVGGNDASLEAAKFFPLDNFQGLGVPDIVADPQSKTQFSGGVYVSYTFSSLLSAQAEVLYTGKGVSYDKDFAMSFGLFGSANGNFKADVAWTYIEVPLLLKVTAPIEGIRPYGFIGPSFSILVDNSTTVEGSAEATVNGQSFELLNGPIPSKFTFRTVDIGAVFGAGFSARMMNTAIGVEARYTMGFQSAIKSVEVTPPLPGQVGTPVSSTSDLDMKNRVMSVMAFMEFYF